MRTLGLLMLLPLAAGAQGQDQSVAPPALIRGVILECDSQAPAGELAVRDAGNEVFRYQFDAKTYAERDGQLIQAWRLKPGEKVEVVSDRSPGSAVRYARTIHVTQPVPPARPLTMGRYRAPNPLGRKLDTAPTGNLTFAGVVFRLNGERVVLHTRVTGEQSILLRADTRYLHEGEIVEAKDLKPNMRVYVRAGRNLYDQVEAYQIIWGSILSPR
ncbi:MAG TPA: hypothetical protein VNY05_21010 [Candidatus Acidoferrales bacterium]|jgi:hypothetical protein|nr:hypothetical protein [Candidatus Acidoferrales bacterium]